MLRFVSFVLALLVVAADPGDGRACPNRQSIEDSLIKVYCPGAAIIVVNATDILYEQAVGHQSLSPAQPMDVEKSIFALASISKPFVAVAVLQLVELNRVGLDTDINQYLSEPVRRISHPLYPSHPITLRQLLSHTASIGAKAGGMFGFLPDDTAFTQTTLADMCFTYLSHNASNWLPIPPGNVTLYSNEGAALAALIVERVTKMPYEEYVKEKIIKPLGIDTNKTGFRLADFENREELVKHYLYAFNASFLEAWKQAMPQLNVTQIPGNLPTWLHVPFFSVVDYPAGLLRMSARSLSVFLRMFINNGSSLLHPRSILEMRTVVGDGNIPYYNQNSTSNNTSPLLSHYGLIWYWQTASNGRRYIGHGGVLPGMAHLMLVNEQNTVGIIVLTNGDTTAPINLSREISETLANIHLTLFDCFESRLTNSSAFCKKVPLFELFFALFLLFHFFSSYY